MSKLNVVGKSALRYEGKEKLNGKALFPQDIKMENMCFGATLRATIPCGYFSLDLKDAFASEGVIDILTAKDVTGKNEHGVLFKDHQVFIEKKIKKAGDPLALVVAETEIQARAALKKIKVTYEELPGVFDPREAMKEDSFKVHDKDNTIVDLHIHKGEVGFSKCAYVVEESFEVPMVDHAFLQPESSIGYMDGDKVIVVCSTQYPHWDRFELAEALGIEEEKIQVINAAVGGAFGGREDITSQIHVALATRKLNRPVKVTYDREESFLAHSKRHPMYFDMKLGCDSRGMLLAMEGTVVADSGAYASWAPNVLRKCLTHLTGPYEIQNVKIDGFNVYTNNPFTGAMRGFGATQSGMVYEQLMDMLAEKAGLTNFEIREKNALKVGSITGTGQLMFASTPMNECISAVKEGMQTIMDEPEKADVLTGYGIAGSIYGTGYGNGWPDVSNNRVKINEEGQVEIYSGFTEVGQGAKTIMAQIAAEVFGVDSNDIIVINEDTDATPDTGTAAASRQTYNTGNAVKKSCLKLKDFMFQKAQEEFGLNNSIALAMENHEIYIKTLPNRRITFKDLTKKYAEELSESASFTAQTTQLDDLGQGAPYWPYGFNTLGVKVEIDPLTGKIDVVDGVFAQDVGKAINPRFIEGQMDGGFVMGLGYALYEDIGLDNGIMRNRKFSSYIIPTAKDMPTLKKVIIEDPEDTGPFGAKGIGESVTIPAAPAILNAIYNACGIRFTKIPVTPIEFMKKFGVDHD